MELLADALEAPEGSREAFVAARCKDDTELRHRVMALLEADRCANQRGFFDAGDEDLVGSSIGPFQVLEKIGEGGMGTVYLAEQTSPVRRRVAIKVIRSGMGTRRVVARFESERQALAMMDDPGIARVYDAGQISNTQPYFVMEYVPGISITEYCDQHRVGIEERLELCARVCRAVQHAHQRGVIHRDLKPSNILVAATQAGPRPKIIDFGVAKALHQKLTDKTIFTEHGQMIGTPGYMSPEQAEMSSLEIDTRSDIYSLGVVLYELITGVLPVDPDTAEGRVMRGAHMLGPAARLASMSESIDDAAKCRDTSVPSLLRRARGELEWIVMRAIHQDRTMRYASMSEFADDLERLMRMEPVLAAPPSGMYRLSRFVARHRAVLLTVMIAALATTLGLLAFGQIRLAPTIAFAVLAIVLLGGLVAALLLLVRARMERDRALAAETRASEASAAAERDRRQAHQQARITHAVSEFLNKDILAGAAPEQQGRDLKVISAIDTAAAVIGERFSDAPLVEAAIRSTIGRTYRSLGVYESARPQLTRALELCREHLGEQDEHTLCALDDCAAVSYELGDDADAERCTREAIAQRQQIKDGTNEALRSSLNHLALIRTRQGDFAEAEALHLETIRLSRSELGPDDEATLTALNNLASWYYRRERFEEAATRHAETLEARRRVLGCEHPHTLISASNLGGTLCRLGRYEQAEKHLRCAVETGVKVLGDEHPHLAAFRRYLGESLLGLGETEQAESVLKEALRVCTQQLGTDHQRSQEIECLLRRARE